MQRAGRAIVRLMPARFALCGGRAARLPWQATGVRALPDRSSIELAWRTPRRRPGTSRRRRDDLSVRSEPPDVRERLRGRRARAAGGPRSRSGRRSIGTPARARGCWPSSRRSPHPASTTSRSARITSCSSSACCCLAARFGGCWRSSRPSRSATA